MDTFWVAIKTIVDILIFLFVLYLIFELKNRKKEAQSQEQKITELKELIKSLDQLIKEAEHSSINISDTALQSQKNIQDLLEKMDKKREELQGVGEKAESVLESIKKQLGPSSNSPGQLKSNQDKYSEAYQLAQTGLNAEEISDQLKLPKGEVELIMDIQLQKRK